VFIAVSSVISAWNSLKQVSVAQTLKL